MRFTNFASISQLFSNQLIKSLYARRFTFVLYYEAAELAANVIKRFNTEAFMFKKFFKISC